MSGPTQRQVKPKADKYTQFVSRGFGKDLAKKLGLPQPAVLRRYDPQIPLPTGPVLLLGSGAGAEALVEALLEWDLDIRRQATPRQKLGAIILVLDDLAAPGEFSEPLRAVGSSLRDLAPHGRLVSISRPVAEGVAPEVAAARHGVDGIVRSVAKELRAGATANGILLADGVQTTAPSALGALRFFLSRRSAFVDGQFLTVSSDRGEAPAEWNLPLAGRVAVVTGAARGIGAAIAKTLARDGARVIVVDVLAAGEQLTAVANAVHGTALQLDITAEDAGERLLDYAAQRYGQLDIVVHNAGITRDKLLANMDAARWDSVITVNIAAQLRINQALLAAAAEGKLFDQSPHLVSVASTSGIAGNRGQSNYAASKAGVIGMVRASAPLLAEYGGTVNAVAPGFIETEMTAKIPFATREVARRINALQQGGRPEDVAEAIAFLASPVADGINGDILRICGQNLVGQ
ncbi:3-oxoacyl-ACP reductase [Acaricomes phytoseiuli]|uniref:3-oxoacyl-ACP reductase n=1 Tax=Acaricomes phytoseiuli TaxID=291968 RepID=UPI00036FA0D2|nr:3-oxoacyl-ACP reductase [Acaricomes phytoseiuli]MCW1250293.1 3-oxoacyl-ACP reductase [Acaricomes phytoseiuli]